MTDGAAIPRERKTTNPETWVDTYADSLYQYAVFRVRLPSVAEDLVQETFLAAFHSRETFKGRSSEKTWLVGILKNKIIDYFRKKNREMPAEKIELMADTLSDAFDESGHWRVGPAPWDTNPDAQFEQEEFMVILQQCIERLPERLAQVFVLREMDELETKKICKLLGISASNAWVMLHRARASLRECLEKNWFK
jgi:RNA polymerase sigma-70 factor (TIGR02943 family)